MANKNKSKKELNPEIIREKEEKRKAQALYDNESDGMMLYPGIFASSTVSSTESTGLIQTIPPSPALTGVFDDLYSYRQAEPIADEDDE